MATRATFPVGSRFRVIRQLGAGGMGEVWLAHDSTLARDVVLKRAIPKEHSGKSDSARLLAEARRAASVNHANIAHIHDVVVDGDEVLIVMEYVDGRTLRNAIPGPCSLEQFLPIAKQICKALIAAHAQHVVHCDIKPGNVMVTAEGEVKVLDFGIARARMRPGDTVELTDASSATSASGTPGYMAPEVLREHEIDQRADIFSLGVVFYELLTGVQPFHGMTRLDTIERTLNDDPLPFAKHGIKTPPAIEGLIRRMLAKHAENRCQTVTEVLRELQEIESLENESTVVEPRGERLRARITARPYTVGIVAVVLLIAGAWTVKKLIEPFFASGPRTGLVTVLPFHVIGDDKESQSFAEGLRETLTSKLTRVSERHNLQVTSASEVARRKVDNPKAARSDLGADYVVEGSLHRTANVVRVNFSLVDTKTMQQVAADNVTEQTGDPFALEDKVVNSILEVLNVKLQPAERDFLGRRNTESATAYEFFLKGVGKLSDYDDPQNLASAIDYLYRALKADPNYAPAYARLGEAFWRRYQVTQNLELIDAARQSCARAVALDDILPESHICLGVIAAGSGKYQQAATEYDRAVTLDPENDDALRGLATAYEKLGKPKEAESAYKRGIQARPNYWAGHTWLGAFYVQMARYEDAAEQFRLAAKAAPKNALVYYSLGGTYIYQGKYTEAIGALKQSIRLRPSQAAYANLGQAYLHVRRYKDAIDAYEHATALDENAAVLYTLYSSLADAYYWAGMRDKAMPAYRRSIELADQQLAVNPDNTDVHTIMAFDFAALGDKPLAESHLRSALKSGAHDPEILFYAARVHQRLNDTSEALQWLKKATAAGYSTADINAAPEFDAVRNDRAYLDAISAGTHATHAQR